MNPDQVVVLALLVVVLLIGFHLYRSLIAPRIRKAIETLFMKIWPKSGRMGINTKEVNCPECGQRQLRVRKPQNRQQLMWGGFTCDNCGTEMDKYGASANS